MDGIKFVEGWLEHKTKEASKWRRYWCVLKGQTIFIFTTEERTVENHIGTLTVDANAHVTVGDGDPKSGYKFSLQTRGRLNKFKTRLMSERELWRGYITTLSKGTVPQDLDLLPEKKEEIRSRVALYWQTAPRTLHSLPLSSSCSSLAQSSSSSSISSQGPFSPVSPYSSQNVFPGTPPSPLSPLSPANPSPSQDSGGRTRVWDAESLRSDFSDPDSQIAASGGSRTELSLGGPIMKHKFSHDVRNQTTPTWFWAGCSRQEAEMVLKKCAKHGNTLMRESRTYRDTGSYVISKCMSVEKDEFNHFEVKRVAEGFKINVENPHNAMATLTEVMDFFVNLSGRATTIPLTCSDPAVLDGTSPYMSRIPPAVGRTNEESGEEELESTPPRKRTVSFSDELPPSSARIPPPAPKLPPSAPPAPPPPPAIPPPTSRALPLAPSQPDPNPASGHKTWAGRSSERGRLSQDLMTDLAERLRKTGKGGSKGDDSDEEGYEEPLPPKREEKRQQARPESETYAEADDAVRTLDSTIDQFDRSDSSHSAADPEDDYEVLPTPPVPCGDAVYTNEAAAPALPPRENEPLPPPPSKQSLKRWETRAKSLPNIEDVSLLQKVEFPRGPVGMVKPSDLKRRETNPQLLPPPPSSLPNTSPTPSSPRAKQTPPVKPKPQPAAETTADVSARRQLRPVGRSVSAAGDSRPPTGAGGRAPSSQAGGDGSVYYQDAASPSELGGVVEEELSFKEKLRRIKQSMDEVSTPPASRNSQVMDNIYQN